MSLCSIAASSSVDVESFTPIPWRTLFAESLLSIHPSYLVDRLPTEGLNITIVEGSWECPLADDA
jgi:hypothetical protein